MQGFRGRRLREQFPRLYHLEAYKEVSIRNKGAWRGDDWMWEWCWRNTPRERVMRDVTKVCNLVQSVQLNKNVKKKCRWELSEDDKFSVKDLRDFIDEKTLGSTGRQFPTPWCKIIPKKVCVFIWRLFHGRFPVCTTLDDIAIDLNTLLCPSCNEVIESLDH
ncbi:reverse transcriptase domain, reverse transcriptase zinc-binding domain protein [Tanacetum coccineum]